MEVLPFPTLSVPNYMTSMKLIFTALLIVPATVFADGPDSFDASANKQAPSQKSENFDKTKKFLPGEEVVTPTGQKLKIWSTEGPVPVSPPPQPFDDPSKQVLPPDSHVVVDESTIDNFNRRRQEGNANNATQNGIRDLNGQNGLNSGNPNTRGQNVIKDLNSRNPAVNGSGRGNFGGRTGTGSTTDDSFDVNSR